MTGHRVALLLAMAIAPSVAVRAEGPWIPRALAAAGPVPQATLLPSSSATPGALPTPAASPLSQAGANVALASNMAPATRAADGDSAGSETASPESPRPESPRPESRSPESRSPAETVPAPPADSGPEFASAGPSLAPAPPLVRLPLVPLDPPVPYYSAYQGAELYPPPSSWLELPGVKLGWNLQRRGRLRAALRPQRPPLRPRRRRALARRRLRAPGPRRLDHHAPDRRRISLRRRTRRVSCHLSIAQQLHHPHRRQLRQRRSRHRHQPAEHERARSRLRLHGVQPGPHSQNQSPAPDSRTLGPGPASRGRAAHSLVDPVVCRRAHRQRLFRFPGGRRPESSASGSPTTLSAADRGSASI